MVRRHVPLGKLPAVIVGSTFMSSKLATNTHTSLCTLDAEALGRVLKKSALSIQLDLGRAPHRLPPPIRIPGTRAALWLESTVLAWLQANQADALGSDRRRGRPTKLEQARRQAAAAARTEAQP